MAKNKTKTVDALSLLTKPMEELTDSEKLALFTYHTLKAVYHMTESAKACGVEVLELENKPFQP